jgi:preprotein translocase subunit SecG
MKILKKLLVRVVMALVALLLILFLALNFIAREAVEVGVKGVKPEVGSGVVCSGSVVGRFLMGLYPIA